MLTTLFGRFYRLQSHHMLLCRACCSQTGNTRAVIGPESSPCSYSVIAAGTLHNIVTHTQNTWALRMMKVVSTGMKSFEVVEATH